MKELDGVDNNIEQSQETVQPATVVARADLAEAHSLASQLINVLHEVPEGDLVGEILANALKLLRDQTNRGDIKLIDKSLKELRYAMKIFAPIGTFARSASSAAPGPWSRTRTTSKPPSSPR